jgi:hypothetical protein
LTEGFPPLHKALYAERVFLLNGLDSQVIMLFCRCPFRLASFAIRVTFLGKHSPLEVAHFHTPASSSQASGGQIRLTLLLLFPSPTILQSIRTVLLILLDPLVHLMKGNLILFRCLPVVMIVGKTVKNNVYSFLMIGRPPPLAHSFRFPFIGF